MREINLNKDTCYSGPQKYNHAKGHSYDFEKVLTKLIYMSCIQVIYI